MAKLKPNQFLLDSHLITERPILYQTEMVKSVLHGLKKQTRRTKGLDYLNINTPSDWIFDLRLIERFFFKHINYPNSSGLDFFCPYGKPGDLLWVRETWCNMQTASKPEDNGIRFRASTEKNNFTWKPSIHMPKAAARIWLMVEDVKVERLQHISEEDAIDEGIQFGKGIDYKGWHYDYEANLYNLSNAKSSFKTLWKSINGQASWQANPWVWVIKFRELSRTGHPSEETILKNHLQVIGEEVAHV
ncbi:hypothetical protein [Mongoliibacter ruber]|uniref:Uncharacterized protein n=1 Tax=Mongoliibacter ruber TaxID=1750599 RepID=A0A2T0WVA9_9BACT|nr:hypothetical protein [Mongoliibacter ruber]PRY90609.1 hypothetical protein CLW00_101273 [Mongoliibacter ruber]